MTVDEAVQQIRAAGLAANARNDTLQIIGAQAYVPPERLNGIGVYTGITFHVSIEDVGFTVCWMSGPQQVTEREVPSLDDAVRVILENVPPAV
jgi:hypothetical protein